MCRNAELTLAIRQFNYLPGDDCRWLYSYSVVVVGVVVDARFAAADDDEDVVDDDDDSLKRQPWFSS